MNRTFITLFFLGAVVLGCNSKKSEIYVSDGKAASGYDVVAYFNDGKAVEGDDQLTYSWKGANWQFASVPNLEAFKNNPEAYAPQFGGYCAYGTAAGHKASTQPDAWAIVDNKLYLNHNKDVQVKWFEKQAELIEKANKAWPEVSTQDF